MNNYSKAAFVIVGLAAAGSAGAQDMYKSGMGGVYAGLNYTFMMLDDNDLDADVGTLSGKVGVDATPFLSLEGRAGFGVDDDTISGVDLSVDNFFGGYANIKLPNESPVTPYAVIGFTRIEAEAKFLGNKVTDDDSDLSYGVGLNMKFQQNLSGNLEYMRYYDDDNLTVDGLGLGIQVNF
ncbi:MAG: porin family protein [Gammaproteobacteria bacterium]|nr:MAG: porin family protein [Gammaproteobacteria bacterium]TNE95646.1 MAG: porin family protein [Gammaproteobacteria bacterium]